MTEHDLLDHLLAGNAVPALERLSTNADGFSGDPTAGVAYFEPRLGDQHGHFAILANTYRATFARLGLAMHVQHHEQGPAGHREASSGLFPTVDHAVGRQRPINAAAMGAFTRYFREAFEIGLARTGARIAVLPTARFLTLPAFAEAVASSQRVAGVVVGVMETWPVPDCDQEAIVSAAFQRAALQLRQSGKAFLVVAESDAIGSWLQEHGFGAGEMLTAPFPAAARFGAPARRHGPDRSPRFLALGSTRPVHDPGLLAEYLVSLDPGDPQWTARLNLEIAAAALGRNADELEHAITTRGVRLLPLALDQQTYDDTLAAANVMLLPYGERYRSLGSGIFLECLCAGVIPLVTRGSTMRAQYEALGGTAPAIEERSVSAIVRAVAETRQRFPDLQRNSVTVREAWFSHPNGPRAWSDRITGLVAGMRA